MNLGAIVRRSGCFTMWRFIEKQDAESLERRLGYDKGRLRPGYLAMVLAPGEVILPDDFDLFMSTRWPLDVLQSSNGMPAALTSRLASIQGQPAVKQRAAHFFNMRGKNAPAKIEPVTAHAEGMRYPPAEAIAPGTPSGVPQFRMRVGREKRWTVVALV